MVRRRNWPPDIYNTPGSGIIHSPRKEIEARLQALWPRLWRFALGLCRNRADAEDLAQATCLRVLENAAKYRDGTHFDRWVLTICRNLWHNECRARRLRQGNGCDCVDALDLPSGSADAQANIFHAEVLSKVMTLPDAQRETLLLVYVEGFTYKEAAGMLDIPVGTVMSRLAAARKKLAPLNKDDPAC